MFDLQKDLVERGSDSKFIITFFMKPDDALQCLKITKKCLISIFVARPKYFLNCLNFRAKCCKIAKMRPI